MQNTYQLTKQSQQSKNILQKAHNKAHHKNALSYHLSSVNQKKVCQKQKNICPNQKQKQQLKLKFNTSYDNLRCFMSKPKIQRFRSISTRLARHSQSESVLRCGKFTARNNLNNRIVEQESKYPNIEIHSTKSQNQNIIKTQQDQNDLSNVLSNQIIHPIQKNGIKYTWEDIEQMKSEQFQMGQSKDQEIQLENLLNVFNDQQNSKSLMVTRRSYHEEYQIKQKAQLKNQMINNYNTQQHNCINNNNRVDPDHSYSQASYENGSLYSCDYQKNFSLDSTMQQYPPIYYQLQIYPSMQQHQQLTQNSIGLRSMPISSQQSHDFIITPEYICNDPRTTLMIKNIPNKYTIHYLSEEIDYDFGNYYDFLYLPCDTKSGANQGYGFINFVDLDAIKRFYQKFHGKKWRRFKSEKICNLTYARLQGIDSLIEHFQNSKVLNHKEKKYQPIIKSLPQIHCLIKKQQNNQMQQKH